MALGLIELAVVFFIVGFVLIRNWRVGLILLGVMVMVGVGVGLLLIPMQVQSPAMVQSTNLPTTFQETHTPVNTVRPRVVEEYATPLMAPSQAVEASDALPDIWKPGGIAEQRPADIYPTREAAAKGLGMGLKVVIEQICTNGKPAIIQVMGQVDNDLVELKTLQALADGLRELYPEDVEILVESQIPNTTILKANSTEGVEVRLTNRITKYSETGQSSRQWLIKEGTLMADLAGPQGKMSRTAAYKDLLWFNDFEAYCKSQGGSQWAVARSSRACGSQDEAINQALTQLGQQISQAPAINGATFLGVKRALNKRTGVTADFVQRIEGESGPIWRAAVLVRLDDVMGGMAESPAPPGVAITMNRYASQPATWFTIIGLIILIIVTGTIIKAMARAGAAHATGSGRHPGLMLLWLIPLLAVAAMFIMRWGLLRHR